MRHIRGIEIELSPMQQCLNSPGRTNTCGASRKCMACAWLPVVALDRPQQRAQLHRIDNRRMVLHRGGRERADQVSRNIMLAAVVATPYRNTRLAKARTCLAASRLPLFSIVFSTDSSSNASISAIGRLSWLKWFQAPPALRNAAAAAPPYAHAW